MTGSILEKQYIEMCLQIKDNHASNYTQHSAVSFTLSSSGKEWIQVKNARKSVPEHKLNMSDMISLHGGMQTALTTARNVVEQSRSLQRAHWL